MLIIVAAYIYDGGGTHLSNHYFRGYSPPDRLPYRFYVDLHSVGCDDSYPGLDVPPQGLHVKATRGIDDSST